MDERDLAAGAAAGNAAAFTALVRVHEGAVRRFLARLTRGDADDLAQEVFVKAWARADRYRGDGSYRGWLFRIALSAFLDTRRGDGRRDAREQAFDAAPAAGDHDLRMDLDRALDRLPARERAAALLCFAEGCSHGEAAAVMVIPLGTLKSILARARTALTAELETAHG
ncbi:MAG: RNA polymerase sigma factor [Pseudomonadota bacterium]